MLLEIPLSFQSINSKAAKAWAEDRDTPERTEIRNSWFREDTVDHWRHARMYEPAKAFLHNSDLTWLTVGDGRYGLDSIRLRRLGCKSVLPTDIGDALLAEARLQGLIDDYRVENAERMSFADDSFDMVFCKESYHHFPRGPLALYEMVRVARHAVILIEPRDYTIDRSPVRSIGPVGLVKGLLSWVRARIGRDIPLPRNRLYQLGDTPGYESVGNYIYTISSRELEKTALGMNLPVLALKGLNDHYESGVELQVAAPDSELFRKVQDSIAKSDRLAKSGAVTTGLLMAVLFKTPPDSSTREYLVQNDWLLLDLPRNPYL